MADKLDDQGFLQRWSTRKADARDGDGDAEVPDEAEAVPVSEEPAPDLPDLETLDANSDYTGFLGANVPQDVAKLALRKLWRSDPVLANLDGLNDYDDDFSKVGMVSEAVKTAYRVGKGFLTDEEAVAGASEDEIAAAPAEGEESPAEEQEPPAEGEEPPVEGEEDAAEFHHTELTKSS